MCTAGKAAQAAAAAAEAEAAERSPEALLRAEEAELAAAQAVQAAAAEEEFKELQALRHVRDAVMTPPSPEATRCTPRCTPLHTAPPSCLTVSTHVPRV